MIVARNSFLVAAVLTAAARCQTQPPGLLYYSFDETAGSTTANLAAPGAGSNPAQVHGQVLSSGAGQFAGGLEGVGGASDVNFVDSGYVTNLTGDWTLGFYIDTSKSVPSGAFQHICGDETAGSWRVFANGVAGQGNLQMRGPLSQATIIAGADPQAPHVVAWVYDSAGPVIHTYLDGALFNTSPQHAPVSLVGSAPFKVGGTGGRLALAQGAVIDEFRLYDRALTGTEIAATWNTPIGGGATAYCNSKVNSLGCIPATSSVGVPSATAGGGFRVDVDMVRNHRPGLFFYTANGARANLTFQCGTLCVGPGGIARTPARSAGGNAPPANDCSGVYSLDFNAFGQGMAGGHPDPALQTMGTQVNAQVWGRDQGFAAPCNTTLSAALEWTQGP